MKNPMMTRKDCISGHAFFVMQVTSMDKHGYFQFRRQCRNGWAAMENRPHHHPGSE
jgi:hypothetical protein